MTTIKERIAALSAELVEDDYTTMREYFNDKYSRATILDNDGIIRVMASYPEDKVEDVTADQWAEAMLAEETREKLSAENAEALAERLAKQFAAVPGFNAELETAVVVEEKAKQGAIFLFRMVRELRPDLLAELPRPGSDNGNNPDVCQIQEPNAKGEIIWKKTTVLQLMADKSEKGAAILKQKRDMQKEMDRETSYMSKPDYRDEMKRLDGNLATVRRQHREMAGLYHRFKDFEACPLIRVSEAKRKVERDGKIVEEFKSTGTPIRIASLEPDYTDMSVQMSVKAFLRLDVAKIAEKAGGVANITFAHVTSYGKRGKGDRDGKLPETMKPDNLESFASSMWNMLDNDDNRNAVNRTIAKADKHGKSVAVSLYRLRKWIDAILDPVDKQVIAWSQEMDAEAKKVAA